MERLAKRSFTVPVGALSQHFPLSFHVRRVADQPNFIGLLYSEQDRTSADFDCTEPLLILAMHPEQLDRNKDGFWSVAEANEVALDLRKRGALEGSQP